ncbi:MAG: restriction endonuclease subunit S, partial [Nitrososphaerota archaeon]
YATRIQLDEIRSIPDERRREELLKTFNKVPTEIIPTEAIVVGISRVGMAKISSSEDGELYKRMLNRLQELDEKDRKKKSIENQARDILIGLTCIKNCFVLVTNDASLKDVMHEFKGHAITFEQFQKGEYREFKDTEIGRIPKDWEVVRIGDICEVIGGGTPSTKVKEYWNGNIPFAIPTDVTELESRNVNFLNQTKGHITEKGLRESSTNLLPPGSILLTSRATIGSCVISEVPVATNQGFANIICGDTVHNLFILYLMKYMKKKLDQLASGSTYKEISRVVVRNLRIPHPPLLEQQEIAEILSIVDKKLELERADKARLGKIKQGLMDLLLTGKIRVKVN